MKLSIVVRTHNEAEHVERHYVERPGWDDTDTEALDAESRRYTLGRPQPLPRR
jgi:hypothetical protein